jgi:hypothetical protein
MRHLARAARRLWCGLVLVYCPALAAQAPSEQDEPKVAPLFVSNDTVPMALSADFRAISKDRDTLNPKSYPAVLTVPSPDGKVDTLRVDLSLRGHFRRSRLGCDIPPLRVRFPKDEKEERKGSLFKGQSSLKLTTHCNTKSKDFEQYILQEYLVYRAYNVLTDVSFRARLVHMTYRQSGDTGSIATRFAFFIEDDGKMAKRNGGTLDKTQGATWEDIKHETGTRLSVFEYFIGNTDWSLPYLHNVRLVRQEGGPYDAAPYDFDWSGVVNAKYAFPDYRLPIKSVRQRLYRGACRSAQDLAPIFDQFRAQREAIYQLYRSAPGLDPGQLKSTLQYYDDFYRLLDSPGKVRDEFAGACG